jgi:predicted nuclease of restriction endonuclease-like (RecB) superfamily
MVSKRKPKAKNMAQRPPQRKAKGVITNDLQLPSSYLEVLEDIKKRVRTARIRASLSVNRELIILYWDIGRLILERQEVEGWGAKVIDRLSFDLNREFPDQKGLSSRNLKYMRAFADAYPEQAFVQEVLAQITWYHNITLLEKVKDPVQREWYSRATIEYGWSRAVLVHQIDSDLYSRQGKALTNFQATLPSPQSDLAQQLVKDPYSFEFLGIGPDISDRQLEAALIERLKDFLIELGKGFAFVGQQYHLDVSDDDYYID